MPASACGRILLCLLGVCYAAAQAIAGSSQTNTTVPAHQPTPTAFSMDVRPGGGPDCAILCAFAAIRYPDSTNTGLDTTTADTDTPAQTTTNQPPIAVIDVQGRASGFTPMLTDRLKNLLEPKSSILGYLSPVTEPTFGTRILRIAGDPGTAIGGGVPGTWGPDTRQHYSKDQPWNADGTLLALENGGGMVLLDGNTYQPQPSHCIDMVGGDSRWHPRLEHAHERIRAGGTELAWYDVVNCIKTRSWKLPFAVNDFGPSEGNPSLDGRFAALTDGRRVFVVDMDPQSPFAPYPGSRIGSAIAVDDCGLSGGCAIDWVSVSPSGKYVVVNYLGDTPRVFEVDPGTLALKPHAMPAASLHCHGTAAKGFIYDLGHADMTLNPFDKQEDVIVGQEHCGNQGRTVNGAAMSGVVMVRLRDDKVTPLTDPTNEAYPHHISARNFDRPGWVYVGYHSDPGYKFNDEIIAVKLDGSRMVQRFAHKHSAYTGCYRCESHSVPSRDGRRVLWASNWALGCSKCGSKSVIKPYVVDARAIEPAGAPAMAPWPVVADASGSSDTDGRVASYKFEFGDGWTTGTQVSPFGPHIYQAGTWTLKLTVTDNSGAATVTTRKLVVSAPGNPSPVAALTISPASGTAPLTVTADASGSRGTVGPIASYRFDFGDGSVQIGTSPAISHRYAAGDWTATVTVMDGVGSTASATSAVHVSVAPPPPADTTSANLVRNPSFERDLTGWKGYGGATLARVRGGRDGSWMLAVHTSPLGGVFGVNDSPNWVMQVPAAGTKYRIAALVRALGLLGVVQLQVREWAGASQVGNTVYSNPVELALPWQQVSVDFTAQRAGSRIDLQVIDTPLLFGTTFYVDAVSIYMVPAVAALALSSRQLPPDGLQLDIAPRATPNPMRGHGAIDFSTAKAGPLRVALFDAAGRAVRVIADEPFAPAGSRHFELDGHDQAGAALPAGVYFCRVESSAGRSQGRIVVLQ